MGKPPHILTRFIKVISADSDGKKAKHTKFSCKICQALNDKPADNRIQRVVAHFRICTGVTEEKRQEILDLGERAIPANTSTLTSGSTSELYDPEKERLPKRRRPSSIDPHLNRFRRIDFQRSFEQLLVEATVECGWSFEWIGRESIKKLFSLLSEYLRLNTNMIPTPSVLRDRLLPETIARIRNDIAVNVDSQMHLTLTFDGWKNVRKENILGCVLLTDKGDVIVWKVEDISSEADHAVNVVVPRMKRLLTELNVLQEREKVVAVVTDSASTYAAARRRMCLLAQHIVFLPCFAHQVNCTVKDIFRTHDSLHKSMQLASKLVEYFNRSTQWRAELKRQQLIHYSRSFMLISHGDTRWNSMEYCASSIVRSQAALQSLLSVERSNPDLPNLTDVVRTILQSAQFFADMITVKELLAIFNEALNTLQKNSARLYHVVYYYGRIIQLFTQQPFPRYIQDIPIDIRLGIVARIEARWKTWEHPILLLAYFLHPRSKNYPMNPAVVNRPTISKWAYNYYKMFFGQSPGRDEDLEGQLNLYRDNEGIFDGEEWSRYETKPVLAFWNHVKEVVPQLSRLAVRIFSITISSAAVERMFSSFKWIQDDRRNRLGNDKLVGITQIRMKVQKEHSKIIAERKRQKELLRMEAEKLWGPSDDAENASQVNIDGADDANSDDLLGVSSDEWTNLSHEWMEMLDGEEESDDDDALYDLESRITNLDTDDSVNEEVEVSVSWDSPQNIRGWRNNMHPSVDPACKIALGQLFRVDLPKPAEFL